MKNIHILYYTAAVLLVITAVLAFVNGGLLQTGVAILVAVGLFMYGSSQREKSRTK
jgi:hypothetical protein